MPSIYLRLPYYVASYYRNRFDDKRLKESDPYVFSVYSDAFYIIRDSILKIGNNSPNLGNLLIEEYMYLCIIIIKKKTER